MSNRFVGALAALHLAAASAAAQNSGPRGDVNGDGAISSVDAQAILAAVVGAPLPLDFSPSPWGDANCSGGVQAVDAQIVLSRVVGMSTGVACIGQPLARVASVTLSAPVSALGIGGTTNAIAVARDSAGAVLSGRAIRFASTDPALATVTAGGVVTGVAFGTARITARSERQTGAIEFRVAHPAGSIQLLEGDAHVGFAGQPMLGVVRVRVTDGTGTPVPNKALQVTTVSGGGSVAAVPVTDTDGFAEFTYTLGDAAGLQEFDVNTPDGPADIAVHLRAFAAPTRNRFAAGFRSSCFVDNAGVASCWGENRGGALGTTAVSSSVAGAHSSVPIPVQTAQTFHSIAGNVAEGNGNSVCASDATGALFCWGVNRDFLLGVNTAETCVNVITDNCVLTPAAVAPGLNFVSFTVGGYASWPRVCGLTDAGDAYCFGEGGSGALGNGTFGNTSMPTPVQGGHKFVQIASGRRHTCGLTPEGGVWCWGSNRFFVNSTAQPSVLGSTSHPDSVATPVQVPTGETFVAVAAGLDHTCALTAEGAAHCWGGTAAGIRTAPTDFSAGQRFSRITVGTSSACAITRDDVTYCWGSTQAGTNGAIGTGLASASFAAAPVAGSQQFASVAAGNFHNCAVATNEEVYCWGLNNGGQAGVGQSASTGGPTAVFTPTRVLFGARPVEAPTAIEVSSQADRSTSVGALTAAPLSVRVTGASGFGVPGVEVQFAVTAGGGLLDSAATMAVFTDSTGFATIPANSWRLGPDAGTNTVTASVVGLGSTAEFHAEGIIAGAAARLTFTFFSDTAGTPGPLLWTRVLDARGFPVSGVPVRFGEPTGDIGETSQPLPAIAVSDADGRAGIELVTAGRVAREDSLPVTVSGALPAQVFVQINPAAPARLSFMDNPQDAVTGAALSPVRVVVQDAFGNNSFSFDPIQLALGGTSPAGVTLQGTTNVSATGGVATFSGVNVPAAGNGFQLVATAPGLLSATSSSFQVGVSAGATLAATRNPDATGSVDGAVTTTPMVVLRDAGNNPIVGATVTFRVVEGAGNLAGATVVTDANGEAALSGWTLGAAPGHNVVEASAPGSDPVRFTVDASWTRRLSTGQFDSCALDNTGAVYCWGDNSGFRPFGTAAVPSSATPFATPVASMNMLTPAITSGHCGRNLSNQFICWGRHDLGTSGPAQVLVSNTINFVNMNLGRILSCGWDVAGVGYCWGLNQQGALGRAADAISATRSVPEPLDGGLTFKKVVAGWTHACGIATDGSMYCWGSNAEGRLGIGSADSDTTHKTPEPVATGEKFIDVILGSRSTCALTEAGRILCWGYNGVGQLGDGTNINRSVPTPVARELRFRAFGINFAGFASTTINTQAAQTAVCALAEDGQAFCWGANGSGQLGDGTTIDRNVPTPVNTNLRFNGIDVGDGHTCAMRGTAVWCWGSNSAGQVGDGTTTDRLLPTRVQFPF